jgi:hypothetical protein
MANRYVGVSLAAALSLCLMGGAAQAQVKIVFNSFAPPTFVINQGMIDVWAKNVERVTEGRVKVEFPANSLAPPPQQWEMVTQGVADGGHGHELRAGGQVAVEVVEVKLAVVGDGHVAQLGANLAGQLLPRDDVCVMLDLGGDHDIAGAQVARPTSRRPG